MGRRSRGESKAGEPEQIADTVQKEPKHRSSQALGARLLGGGDGPRRRACLGDEPANREPVRLVTSPLDAGRRCPLGHGCWVTDETGNSPGLFPPQILSGLGGLIAVLLPHCVARDDPMLLWTHSTSRRHEPCFGAKTDHRSILGRPPPHQNFHVTPGHQYQGTHHYDIVPFSSLSGKVRPRC